MTGLSRRVNAAVATAHDFGRYGVLVHVGGGHGALLAEAGCELLGETPTPTGVSVFEARAV